MNRRRHPRTPLAAVASVKQSDGRWSVWRVNNVSAGGASLVGDLPVVPGSNLSLTLHVPGAPALALKARLLRRQVTARTGRCAVVFLDVSDAQREAIEHAMRMPSEITSAVPRALVVASETPASLKLAGELKALGFTPRRVSSPVDAAAWMQREPTTAVLVVDEGSIELDGWSVLSFARDTAPHVRRLVLAADVRSFRLYFALKAGIVDGLVEANIDLDELRRRVLGTPSDARSAAGR